jgi:hypothetical protein
MALYPCAVGSHRYAGPQQTMYLGLVNGVEAVRSKLRLCNPHFQSLYGYLQEKMTLVAIGDTTQTESENGPDTCGECAMPEPAFTAWAHVYPLKEEQHVFFAAFCKDHVGGFAQRAHIAL